MFSYYTTLISAFVLRLALIAYGCWHDVTFDVKFTDIDYEVFTSAAKQLWQGKSPYYEPTYKYTPLLAILLLPNSFFHKLFGKFLFSCFDIINSIVIRKLLLKMAVRPTTVQQTVNYLLLFNPLVAVISTRGNAESIQNFFVLSMLYCFSTEWRCLSALLLGLAIHFKLYPVIFILPMILNIQARLKGCHPSLTFKYLTSLAVDFNNIQFAFLAISSFLCVGCLMYFWFGYEFLWSTYLFHFSRVDRQHNFSIYFYPLYVASDSHFLTKFIGICAFIPQALIVAYYGIRFYQHVPMAMLMQCFAFVSFNKVCTSQYFIWYIGLLPLAAPWLKISKTSAFKLTSAWIGSQAVWLGLAYLLEFKHYNVAHYVWLASILFLIVNICVLRTLERCFCNTDNDKVRKD